MKVKRALKLAAEQLERDKHTLIEQVKIGRYVDTQLLFGTIKEIDYVQKEVARVNGHT